MSEEKHTKLPWRVDNKAFANAETDGQLVIRSCHGIVAMTCTSHEGLVNAEENAAFIVLACNSQEALLEACKYSHNLILNGVGQHSRAIAFLEAAIALAEKGA